MSSDESVVIGPFEIAATGPVTIASQGAGISIRSAMGDDGLQLDATTNVSLSALPALVTLTSSGPEEGLVVLSGGNLGKIVQTAGIPNLGAEITLKPASLKLSCGPPGLGASITLTPDSITLQVAQVSYKLTPLGITESILEVSRKADLMGHTLTAAETSVKINVAGVVTDAPIVKTSAEATSVCAAPIAQVKTDGVRQEKAGIRMIQ